MRIVVVKLTLFFVLLLNMGCNKYKPDKLDGELSYLVGTWTWDSTQHIYNWCIGSTLEEDIYPESYGNNFSLVFDEKGCISFYANDSILYNKGVTKNTFTDNGDGSKHAVFHLDGDTEDIIAIVGSITSSRVTHFPFDEVEVGCETYLNYFSKQ